KMSDDDIAALLASMGGGEEPAPEASEEAIPEVPAEEPAPEPAPMPELSGDPNAKMSDDDIAALLASMGGGEEPAPEASEEAIPEVPAEEPAPEPAPMPQLSGDPNAKMSDDDIAALLASMGGGEEPAPEASEEPIPADGAAVPDDGNENLSAEDIAALLGTMSGGVTMEGEGYEPVDGSEEEAAPAEEVLIDETPESGEAPSADDLLSGLDMSILDEDLDADSMDPLSMSEEDLEARLNMAKADGEREEVSAVPEDLNQQLMDSGDADFSDIGDMLEKADNNIAVGDEVAALLGNEDATDYAAMALGEEKPAPMTKEEKAAEKKRLREEKKEAKRLAKEKKAAEKAAKKAAKSGKTAPETGEADLSDVEELLRGADAAAGMSGADDEGVADSGSSEDELAALGIDNSPMIDESPATSDEDEILAALLGGADGGAADDAEAPSIDHLEAVSFDEAEGIMADDLDAIREKSEPKKKGFFAKILDFLTEEADDGEDDKDSLKLSDENAQVLEELDAEGGDDKKGKKKKKKDKKAKKGKEAEAPAEGEEGEEGGEAEGKKKKKKEKKPKKEKEPLPDDGKPEKKLNKKAVIMIILICLTLGVVLFLGASFTGNYATKKAGREAYMQGDYQTCYQNLLGKNLNETETVMFNKSECILRIRLWLREYEILSEESEVRALDVLIQSVNAYPNLYTSAVKWNCTEDVSAVYNDMLNILENKYGLTEADAMAIAQEPDDVTYTRLVTAAANGEGYGNAPEEEVPDEPAEPVEVIPDELPEEQDMGGVDFVEQP
nr:hypothetical protein [Lachnospiraceae bacterium]